ncbi:MAG: hypothetical protein ACYC2G_02870 [Gemmatimonadaceae bacterium]
MSSRTLALSMAILVGAAGCARSAQQAPPTQPQPAAAVAPAAALDATGVYDFVAIAQGQEVPGTIDISARNGVYGGVITSSMLPDMPISGVTVAGSKVTVSADSPNGVATLEFTLVGPELTGNWSLGGDGGPVSGRKRGG